MLKYFWKIIRLLVISLATIFALSLYLVYHYSRELPDYTQLENYYPPATTRIYSSDGKLMEEFALEHRIFVPIKSIPKSLIEAFIAAEDKNFYTHPGVDIPSIIKALFRNINNISRGKRISGASTITQQVVKNFLLTSERSFERKIKEAILSYMISKTFSKDRILELYLNQVFLGKGAYGVASAAQIYFNKSVDELTIAESAYIAALPKAPSTYDPKKNYDRSKDRRDYVINRMLEDGYIDLTTAEDAIKQPIILKKREKSETVTANYFVDQVRQEIIQKLGSDELYKDGLTVITTLNPKYQNYAEQALIKGIRDYDKKHGYRGPIATIDIKNWKNDFPSFAVPADILEYRLAVVLSLKASSVVIGLQDGMKAVIPEDELKWAGINLKNKNNILKPGSVIIVEEIKKDRYGLRQIPEVNGAHIVMNPHTGQVLALVGGYSYEKSKFNRATQALRQPGSVFKGLVYLAGLENGLTPASIFRDEPIEIYQGPFLPPWKPKNYKGDFMGAIPLRRALEKSRNIVTIKLANQIGISKIVEITKRFGVDRNPQKIISMVLGSVETTLDRMTNAYSMIINGGKMVKPYFIEVIKDRSGKIIYKRDNRECNDCTVRFIDNNVSVPMPTKNYKFVTDERSAYQLTSMLVGAAKRGTASATKVIGKTVGGKTGTTNDSMDTWFIGFTPNLVSGTYIGFDNPKSLGKHANGANTALPIFNDFMIKALADDIDLAFRVPDGIKFVKVDPNTGEYSNAPNAIMEPFKVHNDLESDTEIKSLFEEEDKPDEQKSSSNKVIPVPKIINKKEDASLKKEKREVITDSSSEIY